RLARALRPVDAAGVAAPAGARRAYGPRRDAARAGRRRRDGRRKADRRGRRRGRDADARRGPPLARAAVRRDAVRSARARRQRRRARRRLARGRARPRQAGLAHERDGRDARRLTPGGHRVAFFQVGRLGSRIGSSVMSAVALVLWTFFTAQEPVPAVKDVAWIAGCWGVDRNGRHVSEQWMLPDGGTMMGVSRTVAGGKTTEWEFLIIREGAKGLEYVAKPSGQ